MPTVRRLRVALNVKKGNVPLFLILAQAVAASMTAHASLFTSLSALVTVLASQTADLAAAQQGVKNKTVGTSVRDAKRDLVAGTLESLRAGLQGLCDANPEQAASLIQASAFKVAAAAVHAKPMLAARRGVASGVVDLVANGRLLSPLRRTKTYTWQFTLDGKIFNAAGTTGYVRTTVTGLPPLTTVGFRVCVTVGDGEPGPWTQVVSILVH